MRAGSLVRHRPAARAPLRAAPPRRFERLTYGLFGVVIVLAGWQVAVQSGWVNEFLLSSPITTARTLFDIFLEREFLRDLWVTLREWLLGFALATVVGVAIGVFAGWSRYARAVVQPWLSVLYAVPELAVIPLFIVWFGIGLTFKVWVAFVAAVFVIALNAMAGVHATDARHLEVASAYRASRGKILRTVIIPGSIPYIMTGLRVGSGRAVAGVIAAEFISSNQGLGFFVNLAGQTLDTPQVMAGILVMAVFGIAVGEFFRMVEARVDNWRATT